VRLASGPDEFRRQLSAAVTEPDQLAGQRQAVARANSWQARADSVERMMKHLT
jgi:hypothetical protein